MDNKDLLQIREDLAGIKKDIANLGQMIRDQREASDRIHMDHEKRIAKMEERHMKYEQNILALPDDHQKIIDTADAVANMRKFLWSIALALASAIVLAIVNIVIKHGAEL